MANNLESIIKGIRAEGLSVINWKPGNRRIFKVLDPSGYEASQGMYSNELRAWFNGYLQGLENNKTKRSS